MGATPTCELTTQSVNILGKSAQCRRFLLTLLLTTSHHLSSRPISIANDSFFERLAAYADEALSILRADGWESLGPQIEEGISILEPISGLAPGHKSQREMARQFGKNFRRYFKELNVPWSALPPVDRLTVEDWPPPARVFLAVGPNIGIGDEMILFEAVRRLSSCYPNACVEVSTFHPSLWALCNGVSEVCENQSSLHPYARAKELLQREPSTLVLFIEFASAPIYRQLEQVPGLGRFIYIDTGARVVRMVDQTKPAIMEYISEDTDSVYDVTDDLLNHIALSKSGKAKRLAANARRRTRQRVFVNPYTSKDTSEISPQWWASILNYAASKVPIDAALFTGINDDTRRYARSIQKLLEPTLCTSELFGTGELPTIGDTIQKAIACDAVLGMDTFTGHLGNIASTPSVTVFLSSSWFAWRVPDAAVLNVSLHDDPERIGDLLSRLLVKPQGDAFVNLARELNHEAEGIRQMLPFPDLTGLLPALRRCIVLAGRLAELDPGLEASFADLPPAFLSPLVQALSETPSPTQALRAVLADAWSQWRNCNFSRYLRFVAA